MMDMNTLAWVSGKKILGGAKFSMTATIPFAKLPDFRFHRSGQRRRRVSTIRTINHSFWAGKKGPRFVLFTVSWLRPAASGPAQTTMSGRATGHTLSLLTSSI